MVVGTDAGQIMSEIFRRRASRAASSIVITCLGVGEPCFCTRQSLLWLEQAGQRLGRLRWLNFDTVSLEMCCKGIFLMRSVASGLLLFTMAAAADEYRCQPAIKHYCSATSCVTETDGFQHAEIFFYNSDGPTLGACLWTNCYFGAASQFTSADDEQTTVMGQLQPDHSPEMYPPILISLTLSRQLDFTAIWHYSGATITLDHGKCELRKS